MTIAVDKKEFCALVKPMKSAMRNRLTNADGLLFDGKNRIIADNAEIHIMASFDYEGDAFVMPLKAVEFIESLPSGEVLIEPTAKYVTIKSKAGTGRFSTLLPDNYFRMPLDDATNAVSFDASIIDSIGSVLFATAKDNNIHSGVCIQSDSGAYVEAAALDGFRMAWTTADITNQGEPFRFVLPAAIATKLVSIGSEGHVGIFYSKKQCAVVTDKYTIASRMIGGDFLDWKTVAPKSSNIEIVANREALLDAVNRAVICNGAEKLPIDLSIHNNMLTVKSLSTIAAYSTEFDVAKTGVDSLDISLNGRFLLDALRADEGETVTMAFNGPTAPVLIKTERLSNVVLPVKRRA